MEKATTVLSIMNYDPNLTTCMKQAEHVVKITLSQWHYTQAYHVTVTTNMRGLDVIRYAVDVLYDSLPSETVYDTDRGRYIHITSVDIGELLCTDEAQEGREWLREMVIGAEIVSIKPAEGE